MGYIRFASSFDSAVGIVDGVLLESFFITFTVGGLINWLVGWLDGLLVNELPGGVTFILHPCLGRDVRRERGKGQRGRMDCDRD